MQIVPIHYSVSKPVVSFKEIEKEAYEMTSFIVTGPFGGLYNKAFAIAHCQVSETPLAFFVVSPDVIAEKMFESQIIINPKIISSPDFRKVDKFSYPNKQTFMEPCMSFPFRKPKSVERWGNIQVKYQIKGFWGLKTVKKELIGIASEIFQHEVDHINGKNIYFPDTKTYKWWELIGNEKSKGGNSLEDLSKELLDKKIFEVAVDDKQWLSSKKYNATTTNLIIDKTKNDIYKPLTATEVKVEEQAKRGKITIFNNLT